MNTKTNVILLLVDIHWGEIDWILPILHKLREQKQDWQIVAVFRSPELLAKREHHYSLNKELEDIADFVVAPAPKGFFGKLIYNIINCLPARALAYYTDCLLQKIFRTPPGTYYTTFLYDTQFLFPKIVKPENVRIILKDFANDSRFDRKIEKCCPKAKKVVFPHGACIYFSQECNRRLNPEILRHYHTHDLFLVSSDYSAQWWADQHCQEDAVPVGFPRLDKWWVDKIVSRQNFIESEEYQKAKKADKVFLFITRHPTKNRYNRDELVAFVRSVAKVALAEKGSFLFLKPHPNQDVDDLASMLEGFDSSRWCISSLQAIQLCYLSDFVISTFSSCVLDALAVDKPVVEFFKYKSSADEYTERNDDFVMCPNGKLGSVYRMFDLVASADTEEELKAHVDDYFSTENHPPESIWTKQKEAYKRICNSPDGSSSTNVAEKILQLVK